MKTRFKFGRGSEWMPLALLLLAFTLPVQASESFDPHHCQEKFLMELRMLNGDFHHPTRYLTAETLIPKGEEFQTYHLASMMGLHGSRVDMALYRDANSILFLSDGSGVNALGRLGPVVAKQFPKKTVVSAEFDVAESGFVNNWGFVKVDNREAFPIRDNSFDRVVMRRGICLCHNGTCCGGFKPQSETAKGFLKEVARVLNKKDPKSFAVLHGPDNVGMDDIQAWDRYLTEISKTEPIQHEFMYENGLFHSILIRPRK